MASDYVLQSDGWILKQWRTAEIQRHSVSA